MTDVKTLTRSSAGRPRRKWKRKTMVVPRISWNSPVVNTMILKASWTQTALSSGTTGTIAYTTSPSIQNASEYSVLQNLFTEIRLLKAKVTLTSENFTSAQGMLVMSTNMNQNLNNMTNPTSFVDVENQTKARVVSTYQVTPLIYQMPVPPRLEFSTITNDAPATSTPYAGSPGAVRFYASGLTNSTSYFQILITCIYELRGRQ